MLNIVIFGAPGSGKGTQSERLTNEYGLLHISTGEVLREQISQGTELGAIADSYISQGHLIPDDLMVNVLADVLDKNPEKTARGVIFDGFPRTIAQAQALNDMLAKRGTRVSAVIGLEVDEEDLIKRMLDRGRQSGRADDNIETIRERLVVYHRQTAPLRDFYVSEGIYLAIDGNGDIETIFRSIKASIDDIKG